MSKPDFDPQPGKVWAIQIYPGGRQQWIQVTPTELAYSLAEAAAEKLGRGIYVLVPSEEIANIVERKRQRGVT